MPWTAIIAPGEQVVAVLVLAHGGGEPRLLKERTFTFDVAQRAAGNAQPR
jgi:hypothetical protein